MLRLTAIPASILFLFLVIAEQYLSSNIRSRVIVVLAVLSIVIWIQSNVLVWEYGVLNGINIDWTKGKWRGFLDSSIWLACISGSVLFYKRIKKNMIKWAVAIFALQFLSVTYMCLENWSSIHIHRTGNTKEDLESFSNFSTKHNILHILVDGFQSDVFLDLVSSKQFGENYTTSFSGFEYYEETLGVFPFTRFSVPAILSGKLYNNDIPKDDFIDTALSNKTILNTATEFGYEIDMAIGNPYLAKKYANIRYNNFYEISADDIISETVKLLDLSLFRLVPHFVKPYIYNNQEWLLDPFILGESPIGTYISHTAFLNNMISKMHVDRDIPVYKYMHIMNTHNPMVITGNCRYAGRSLHTTRINLTTQSRCTLDTLVKLFEKMKMLNIYDESLVIVHADHGGWVQNHREGQPIVFADGKIAPPYVASLASPLLMIKLPGAGNEFHKSTVYASLADIPDTLSDAMNWNADFGHKSLLEIDPNKTRERRYRFYFWQSDAWETDYTGPIQEFIINGSHYEEEWQLGQIYPPPE